MVGRILIGIGIFLFIAIVGAIKLRISVLKKAKLRDFIITYNNNFVEYAEKRDYDKYSILIREMNEAQRLLGNNGYAKLRLPFENGYHNNVPILSLLITIENERRSLYNDSAQYIRFIQVALTRTIGDYDNQIASEQKRIANVFIDFYKGFNLIISLPFVVLSYMFTGKNVFDEQISQPVKTTLRVFSFILQTIGVISGIMTIILGYQDFSTLIMSWFR